MKLKNEEKMTWKRKLVRHTLAEVQKRRSLQHFISAYVSCQILFSERIVQPLLSPTQERVSTMQKVGPRL